ncbi:MAG: hypothetical protein IKV20_05130 [Clostridia bacterium]|nr:hypothetical protein [Clostridia bacterium]
MKKVVLALTLVLTLAVSLVALTSCGGGSDECDHIWGTAATVDKAPTCTEEGAESVKCLDCGEKKADSVTAIPATGHAYTTDSTTAANCTTDGSETKVCSTCGDTTITTIPATGEHTWGTIPTIDVQGTCTTEGTKSIKCTVCQAVKPDSTEVIPAEHVWGVIATADTLPTCTTEGVKTVKCIFCNEKQAGTEETIPATGHSDVPVVVAPTFFSEGFAEGKCSACNEDLSYTLPKSEPIVYSSDSKSGEIKENWLVGDILNSGEKHFYPTEDDPDGNALYVEYSILWNSTLLGIRDGYGYMTSPRIEGYNNNDYDAAYWISLKNNEKTSWSTFAGSFEVIVMNGNVPLYGPPMNAEALPKEDYPNFGDYGWHRIGIEMKETAVAVPNSVEKTMIVTLYIDGVKVSSYDMGIRYEHNWFFNAQNVDGVLEYEEISEGAVILPYYLPNIKPAEGYGTVYFIVADVSITCGDGFVMPVTKLDTPVEGTYTTEDGTELDANVYFTIGSETPDEPDVPDEPEVCTHPNAEYTVAKIATMFSEGLEEGTCPDCGQQASRNIPMTEISTKVVTKSSGSHDNYRWFHEYHFLEDLVSEDNHFYDENNSLFIEYSILINESFDATVWHSSNAAWFILGTIGNTSGDDNTLNKIGWFHRDTNDSACPYVGGVEPNGTVTRFYEDNGIVEKQGDFYAMKEALYYGWHRIGVQINQTHEGKGDDAEYTVTATIFIDGEKIMDITYDSWKTENLLYTVDENGVCHDNDNSEIEVTTFILQRLIPKDSSDKVYIPVADTHVTCGTDFVMPVTKLDTPIEGTYTTEDGTELDADVYFTYGSEDAEENAGNGGASEDADDSASEDSGTTTPLIPGLGTATGN